MTSSEQKTYSTFCVLWGLATLFHLLAKDPWPAPWLSTALAAAAFYLLHRPAAPHRLVVLAVVQVCESWTTAPFISNHWLFTGLVNLTLLQAYVRLAWAGRALAVEPGALYRTFAPIVRLELLLLYFFAVFHKLNADFLDPQISCAVHFYAAQLPLLPSALAGAAPIYLTLAVETAIPLLLCWPPSRNAGMLLGLLFHAIVGFNPISEFYNFSSMMFALLFLFASPRLDAGSRRLVATAWPFCAAAVVGLGVLVSAPAAWGLYSAGLIVAFFFLPKAPPARPAFSFRPWPVLLVPLLIGLNGCSPYLGLKTETAFAMYSNLRTEGGQTNHLLVPAGVQLFGFQRDLIEIKGSSSGFLASLARRDLMLPCFEVRALLQQQPNTSLTYERHTDSSAGPSAQLRQPIQWPLRKLLYFRPVAHSGPQPCFH